MKPEHRIFADEYLKDHNASRAYRVAYPNCKSDKAVISNACRLLKNAYVSEYINIYEEAKSDELNKRRIMSLADLMEFYSKIVRAEEIDETVTPTGKVVKSKPRMTERISAADKLAKMLGGDKLIDKKRYKLEKKKLEHEISKDGENSDSGCSVVIEV